jgi:hypothetical protein
VAMVEANVILPALAEKIQHQTHLLQRNTITLRYKKEAARVELDAMERFVYLLRLPVGGAV